VQQMLAMSSGPLLTPFEMPSMLQHFIQRRREQEAAAPLLAAGGAYSGGPGTPLLDSFYTAPAPEQQAPERRQPHMEHDIVPLLEVEKRAILRALNYTKGDRSVAVTLLGIGRTTLHRKLKEYQVAV